MKYVIDACNYLFTQRKLEETLEKHGFPAARQLLVNQLSKFAHAAKLETVTAVFDGSEEGAHLPRKQTEAAGKVTLLYATTPLDADRMIIELVEDAQSPGEICVVSNDKFVIRNVQKAGGKQLGCKEFAREMRRARQAALDPLEGEDPRKFLGRLLSEREVEEWSKIFKLKPGE